MDLDLADIITNRILGVSVNFTTYEQTIPINQYTTVTLSSSTYIGLSGQSQYKIGFDPFKFIPTLSKNLPE